MFDFNNLANIYNLNGEIDPEEEFEFFVYLYNEMRKWFEIVYPPRQVVHNAGFTGAGIVNNMLNGHWRLYFDSCRMMSDSFRSLCNILR